MRFNLDAVRARHPVNKSEEVQGYILGSCHAAASEVGNLPRKQTAAIDPYRRQIASQL
jgi:hypothetical protein